MRMLRVVFFTAILIIYTLSHISYADEKVFISSTHYQENTENLDFDKGTIHVFIANHGDTDVEVKEVFLNEKKVDFFGYKVLWYRVSPINKIKPGMVGNVTINLTTRLFDIVKVEIKLTNGKSLISRVVPIISPFKITYITASDDLKNIYVYVKNQSDKVNPRDIIPYQPSTDTRIEFSRIYVNGKDVTSKSLFIEPRILPEEVGLIIVENIQLKLGDYVSVKVENQRREAIESSIKIFTHFPITDYYNDTRKGMYFDPEPHFLPLDPKEGKKHKPDHIYYIGSDPFCEDFKIGKTGANVKRVIEQYEQIYREDPIHPMFVFGCILGIEENYPIYSEVGDAFSPGPYVIVANNKPPKDCTKYLRLAKNYCEPKPLWFTADAFSYRAPEPTPEEERLLIYYALSEGVKGIQYFGSGSSQGYKNFPDLDNEIGRINNELQMIKGLLRISERIGIAKCNKEKIFCPVLLCGDKAMIVLVINEDNVSNLVEGKERKRKFEYVKKSNLEININLPLWAKVKGVKRLETKPKGSSSVNWEIKNENLSVKLPKLEITELIIVEIERKEEAQFRPAEKREETIDLFDFKTTNNIQEDIEKLSEKLGKLETFSPEKTEKILNKMRAIAMILLKDCDDEYLKIDIYKILIAILRMLGEHKERFRMSNEYITYMENEFGHENTFDEIGRIFSEYSDRNDYIEAIKVFERMIKNYPKEDVLKIYGEKYIDCYKEWQGIDKAIEIAEKFPDNPEIIFSLGMLLWKKYLSKEDFKKSIELFERIIKRFPDYEKIDYVQYLIGYLYYTSGDYGNAKINFQKVIEKYPESEHLKSAKDFIEGIKMKKGIK